MQKISFLSVLFFVLVCSCKKDPQIIPPAPVAPPYLIIDSVAGSAASVTTLEPPYVLKGQNSTVTFTLDVNDDGTADFELIHYYSSQFGFSSTERSRIRTLQPDASVRVDSFYYTTTNVYTAGNIVNTFNNVRDSVYVKVMKNKDTLYPTHKFRQGSIYMNSYAGTGNEQIFGSITTDNIWYNRNRSYIGFKLGERLGWIRLSTAKANGMTIYSYARKK